MRIILLPHVLFFSLSFLHIEILKKKHQRKYNVEVKCTQPAILNLRTPAIKEHNSFTFMNVCQYTEFLILVKISNCDIWCCILCRFSRFNFDVVSPLILLRDDTSILRQFAETIPLKYFYNVLFDIFLRVIMYQDL
jgi:hypothetical protein